MSGFPRYIIVDGFSPYALGEAWNTHVARAHRQFEPSSKRALHLQKCPSFQYIFGIPN